MRRKNNKNNIPLKAVIFDLDGVVTKTAKVHAQSWKEMFDEYLRIREKRNREPFKEFTVSGDYLTYVDGKPRYKGVASFLESRGIVIPFGDPSDEPDKETVCGLGNKKNITFNAILEKNGAEIYPSTVNLIHDLKKRHIRIGVASSSKNCQQILRSVALEELFETRVDGVISAQMGLKGKPEPDIFAVAAKNLGATPEESVVVEDAVSGVQAGAKGKFGLVIGLAREHNDKDLQANGADIVLSDFSGTNAETVLEWFQKKNCR